MNSTLDRGPRKGNLNKMSLCSIPNGQWQCTLVPQSSQKCVYILLNIFANPNLKKHHIEQWLIRVIRARLQPPIKATNMPGKDLLKKVVVIKQKRGDLRPYTHCARGGSCLPPPNIGSQGPPSPDTPVPRVRNISTNKLIKKYFQTVNLQTILIYH